MQRAAVTIGGKSSPISSCFEEHMRSWRMPTAQGKPETVEFGVIVRWKNP